MVYMFANSAFTPPSVSNNCSGDTLSSGSSSKKALQPDNPINAHNENIDKIFFFMVFQN